MYMSYMIISLTFLPIRLVSLPILVYPLAKHMYLDIYFIIYGRKFLISDIIRNIFKIYVILVYMIVEYV